MENLSIYQTLILVLSYIVLFVFGLKGFSKEVQDLGKDRLKSWLSRFTSNRYRGFLLGAIITAIIQSSSATTSMATAMVDAGIISFRNCLGILLGANVGTTVTAWIVSLKLTQMGSIIIILGAIVSALPYRIHLIGKSLFYFGFIFFCLELIQNALIPVTNDATMMAWLSYLSNPYAAIIVGMILTVITQSSSVVTGLIIVFIQNNLIDINEAIGLILGSNIGTTSTALMAGLGMNQAAKRAALSNMLFNVFGVIVFIPLITILAKLVNMIDVENSYRVAIAQLIFNLSIALLFLPMLKPFSTLVLRISPDKPTFQEEENKAI